MPQDNSSLTNRLCDESSPYLQQHQDNPVAWQAWSPETLGRAKKENKPILLSVGYAACHWCHVMAHECFENDEIAALMNRHFINIKVDREERPDLDSIYQSALALLRQPGGWPLTMFLTPAGEPFWGGTYFPPTARFGRPGFPQVLLAIAETYEKEPDKVVKNVDALCEGLRGLAQNAIGDGISLEAISKIAEAILRQFDPIEGGFGAAPKFPQTGMMNLLWWAWKESGAAPYRNAVELTLGKMAQGGIYDHLGGGFSRYAVDDAWLVPHFEKMLYDNAQLLQCLTRTWQDTGNPLYEMRARETVTWVLREMMADADGSGERTCGAFAASLDADSEGEEGKFYVWQKSEVERLLGGDSDLFCEAYDVTEAGNWEGKNILNRSHNPELRNSPTEEKLAELRARLLAERGARVRPSWDDKVLADWNGLMITALTEAAPVFHEASWLTAAETAFAFVREEMQEAGRLKHSWRHGKLKHPATLDDYANICEAALALYEATGKKDYLVQAKAWMEVVDKHYWDSEHHGYFFTADDTTELIVRSKAAYDNAVPNGNGTLIGVLARLYFLTGEDAFRARAEALIAAFAGEINRNYIPLTTYLNNCLLLLDALQIVVVGARADTDTKALLEAIQSHCLPTKVLQLIAPDERLPQGHPAQGKGQIDGKATCYLCRGTSCSLPIVTAAALHEALAKGRGDVGPAD